MKLNGTVQCDGYGPIGKDGVIFTLSGTTVAAAAALEPPYIVTDDGGETVADYTGFECTGVRLFGESSVQLRAARELSTEAREAIRAVEGNLTALTATVGAVDGKADTAQSAADSAVSTAQEAKATADTAAASVNEYMDALLGLNATDETEATDAE